MSVDLASEIWNECKRYINTVDRDEAAENIVSILIDNDFSPEEIKSSFKGDSNIKKALVEYSQDSNDDEEYDEDEDEDEDEYY